MTKECLKSRGKLSGDKERYIILVMMGTRLDAQSFCKEVGIGLGSHCLLGRDSNRRDISVSNFIWKVVRDGEQGKS